MTENSQRSAIILLKAQGENSVALDAGQASPVVVTADSQVTAINAHWLPLIYR